MTDTETDVNRIRAEFIGKRLFLVFLLPTDKAGERSQVRLEHFRFVKRLEAEGRLFAAGPYVDEASGKPTGEGLFIVRGVSSDEVARIVSEDPFYKGGFRTFRIQPWQLNEGSLTVRLSLSERRVELD
ncbi:MAG TPA: YciI family protein [Alphaproteobacteria bacterium]|nr:YciI family protein [Alphaproteobacteria bacterium]